MYKINEASLFQKNKGLYYTADNTTMGQNSIETVYVHR